MSPLSNQDSMDQLIEDVTKTVHWIMSQPPYDPSHDHTHNKRVVGYAKQLLESERRLHPQVVFNENLVILAATLHDIGDHKYETSPTSAEVLAPVTAQSIMLQHGASAELAATVQLLVLNVSFLEEQKDNGKVVDIVAKHPGLVIVQDADRIDAIGAHGLGRLFMYSMGVGRTLDETKDLCHAVIVERQRMMKTRRGMQMAAESNKLMEMFSALWERENLMIERKVLRAIAVE